MSERRFHLRSQTAEAHRALDSALGSITSSSDYIRYLKVMAAFRGGIERHLGEDPFAGGAFLPTRLQDSLDTDCLDLGLEKVRPMAITLEMTPDACLGITYVLEGSALGAPFLLESAKTVGFSEEYGAQHLAQQIAAKGNWGKFTALLEQAPSVNMARVSDAAIATFGLAMHAARDCKHV